MRTRTNTTTEITTGALALGLTLAASAAGPVELHADADRADYLALEPVRIYMTMTAAAPDAALDPSLGACSMQLMRIGDDESIAVVAEMPIEQTWAAADGPFQMTHWFEGGFDAGSHRFIAQVSRSDADGFMHVQQSNELTVAVVAPEGADADAHAFLQADTAKGITLCPARRADLDAEQCRAFIEAHATSRYADYARYQLGLEADGTTAADPATLAALAAEAPRDFALLPQTYRRLLEHHSAAGDTEACAALAARYRADGLQMKSFASADRALADLIEAATEVATGADDTPMP